MATWRELMKEAAGDDEIIACTLNDTELDREFYDGFGVEEGSPFTAWSKTRVYFPIGHSGAEWVSSAPRNPCDEACAHAGG